MARETSKSAYQAIMSNDTLSQRRRDVYDVLFKHGPLSATEVCNYLSLPRDSISPRLSELARLSIVKEFGTKKCPVTGQTVVAWDVTKSLPRGSLKSKPRRRWVLAVGKDKTVAFAAKAEAKAYAKSHPSKLIEVVECKPKLTTKAAKATTAAAAKNSNNKLTTKTATSSTKVAPTKANNKAKNSKNATKSKPKTKAKKK